jgi:hypothetical protein
MAPHPNIKTRQPPSGGDVLRAVIYAPEPTRAKWIDNELAEEKFTLQVARTVEQVVSALVEDPPPRPQLLIADFDAVSPAELLHLHAIRDQGWFGTVIALGNVPMATRKSLNIDRVIAPPFTRHTLRNAVGNAGIMGPTTKIPKLP